MVALMPKIYCDSCEHYFDPGDPHIRDQEVNAELNNVERCNGCDLRAEIVGELDGTRKIVTAALAQILALDGQKASASVVKLLTWLGERPALY